MISKNSSKFLRTFSISQIFLLLISVVAFSYAIGSEIGEVSGETNKFQCGANDFLDNCWNKMPDEVKKRFFNNEESKFRQSEIKRSNTGYVESIDEPVLKTLIEFEYEVPDTPVTPPANAPPSTPAPAAGATPEPTTPGNDQIDYSKIEEGGITPQQISQGPQAVSQEDGSIKYCVFNTDKCFDNLNEYNAFIATTTAGAGASQLAAQEAEKAAFLSVLGESALWAAGFYATITLFGPIFGFDEQQTNSIAKAGTLGLLVGKSVSGYGAKYMWFENAETASTWGTYAGISVAVAYFLYNYEELETKSVKFSCIPWQAPLGGGECEKCNNNFLPCSEYQCKSLGQSCELVNKGTTEEQCVWVNRNDVTAPIINANEEALLNENYQYVPDSAVLPPDRGVKVEFLGSDDKCVPAFTPLRIGITSNEPAKCKVDVLRKNDFETMDVLMSQGLLQYNHTFSLSLPGSDSLNSSGIEVTNDGNFDLFVRCEDANGNSNVGTFVFKYCIDKGPDTTPPLIVATSIPDNSPIAYNQSSLELEVYVNEPSECKWSHNNREYDSMETEMDCATTIGETNAQGLYTCTTELTGLKDRFVNKFYFRCKDKPQSQENERNENSESFQFNIVGTQALVIDSVLPNGTIKDSSSVVKTTFEVKTSAGFKEGESSCYYSNTGEEDDFVKFFETDSYQHKQELFLSPASYIYYIRCIDLGGNRDDETISFTIESDNQGPIVSRVSHEEQYLKLITNEEAKCVYDVVDCSYPFDEGTQITAIDGTAHFTDWNIKSNLYIKCQDSYGNQPLPNECSIIVKTTEF